MKRKIAVILASDVAAYSRLVAADEEATLERFTAASQLFRDLVSRYSGRVFNTAGDAILAEFGSAVDAVRCALHIQSALHAHDPDAKQDDRIRFRIGIEMGDVMIAENGDLLGDSVNIAARLESLAEPGSICVSRDVHALVAGKIKVEVSDLGDKALKNLPRPVHVFRLKPLPTTRVLIATTDGPVDVQGLLEEDPRIGRSVACIGGTTTTAGIDRDYSAFVARGTGVIERLYDHGFYRLDVSGRIDAGSSWQLGVFIAHALHAAGRLAGERQDAETIVWATGQVRPLDLSVGDVGHVAQKLRLSLSRLREEAKAGRKILLAWPKINAADADPELREELQKIGAQVLEIDSVSLVLPALGLPSHAASPEKVTWQGSPFRGLEPFGEDHRDVFFGRGKAREEALERLRRAAARDCAFLLVHGRSGAGKSSLVCAGLIGDIAASASEARVWRHAVFRPGSAPSPLSALAEAVLKITPEITLSSDELASLVLDRPGDAASTIVAAFAAVVETKLILVVDQLEELLVWAREPSTERLAALEAFAETLSRLSRSGAVWVIATLRSDLIPLLENSPVLSRLASDEHLYRLERPTRAEIKEIVLRPAAAAQLKLEGSDPSGLPFADVLIEAAAAAPDSLPLLQFILARLYDQEGRTGALSYAAYDRLGGLAGAIGRWAEETVSALGDGERLQETIEEVLLSLGQHDQEGAMIAARTLILDDETNSTAREQLIEALSKARLIVLDKKNAYRTVRVAHEAVLNHWPRAKSLFEKHARDLDLRDRLENQASTWAGEKHDASYLIPSGRQLAEAIDLRHHPRIKISRQADRLVRASIAADQYSRRRWYAASAAAFALTAFLAVFASWGWWRASAEKQLSDSARQVATEERSKASVAEEAAIKERDQALMTQSRFLTELSAQQMSRGDSVTAALLALEALPSPGDKPGRPFVTSAATSLNLALAQWRDRLVMGGHSATVRNGVYSSDGDRVATVSDDRTCRIWDARTGKQLLVLSGHQGALSKAAFSPDGTTIATSSFDKTVRVWNANTGELIRTLTGHADGVLSVSFSRDGKRLLSYSNDGTFKIWSAADGAEIASRKPDKGAWWWPAFSPDGTKIVASDGADHILIWDGVTGAPVQLHEPPEGLAVVTKLTFSSDGRYVLVARSGLPNGRDVFKGVIEKVIFSVETGEALIRIQLAEEAALEIDNLLTPREIEFGQTELEHSGHIYLIRNGVLEAHKFTDTNGRFETTAASPDQAEWRVDAEPGHLSIFTVRDEYGDVKSSTIAVCGDRSIYLFSRRGNKVASLNGHDERIWSCAWHPSNPELLTTSADRTARIWSDAGGKINVSESHYGGSVEFIGGDGNILIGNKIVASATGTKLASLPCCDTVAGSRSGKLFVSLQDKKKAARILKFGMDLSKASPPEELGSRAQENKVVEVAAIHGHKAEIRFAVFSPNEELLATFSADGEAKVWRTANGENVLTVQSDNSAILEAKNEKDHPKPYASEPKGGLGFTADGALLVITSLEGTASIWNISTREKVADLIGDRDVLDVRLSPVGKTVMGICASGKIRLWGIDGHLVREWQAHSKGVTTAAFSPDAKMIVSGSHDGTVMVWNADNGTPIMKLSGHTAGITRVEFDSRGQKILTVGGGWHQLGNEDGSVRIWNVSNRYLIEVLRPAGGKASDARFDLSGERIVLVPVDSDQPIEIWTAPVDSPLMVRGARSSLSRCLTPQQRALVYLDPQPPRWCITGAGKEQNRDASNWAGKWPYNSDRWKAWLVAKDKGNEMLLPAD